MVDAESADRTDRSRLLPLPLLFFLCVLAIRLPVMIAHQDTWYPFEVHSGTIAHALLSGFDLDVARLPIVPHIRGGVLFGVLLVPLYAVLGASAFAMKLLPMLWHAATIALLVHLLSRNGKRRAAIAAGILFCAAPPMLAKLSTIGLASHLESMLPFLLAFAAWQRAERLEERWLPAWVLGLAIGFAGFFHLQALLPCIPIAGLFTLSALRNRVTHLLVLLLGIGIGAAPSFLFDGGNVALLRASLVHQADAAPAATDTNPLDVEIDPTAPPPASDKAVGLLTHDFAFALEFGDLSAAHGVALGALYSLLALLLAVLGLGQDRRWLTSLLDTLRFRSSVPSLELVLTLHFALVIVLYLFSHARHQEEIGAGLTNRHLAPAFFSLLALAALGVESQKRGGLWMAPLVALGIAALPSIAHPTAAHRLPQRGECLEWVIGILGIHEQPIELWQALAEHDRGDAEFRALRFPLALARTAPDEPDFAVREAKIAARLPRPVALASLTAAGRLFAPRLTVGYSPRSSPPFRDFDAEETAAFFHGVGQSLRPPAGRRPNRVESVVLHATPADRTRNSG